MRPHRFGALLVQAVTLASPLPAYAAGQHCMARVIGDVAAEEAPEEIKSKSSGEFGPVMKIKVSRKTGRMVYCGQNTYCYNSNAFELVTPCRVKLDKNASDQSAFIYFTR